MKRLFKILLTLAITTIIVLGFAMPLNPVGNWYQQFLPNLNGAQVTDMTFTDSLNGFIVTTIGGSNSNILKTTNGGDNWVVKFTHNQPFVKVKFINSSTGFTNAFTTIFKTTNAGENWTPISLPSIFGDDMFVLNQDTIWLAMASNPTGGVYRTTNGGANWQNQLNLGSLNPVNIYFYNGSTGYISKNTGSSYVRKTTDGGQTWNININGEGFTDIYFFDAFTGFLSYATMKKTTDGGLNWVNQTLPSGGIIITSQILKFTKINKDTIWGVGGHVFYPGGTGNRGMIYRTTNGGNTWLFQIPDTSINIGFYNYLTFINKNTGWAYSNGPGIHTTAGGDPVWLTPLIQISNEVPEEYKLFNNYPNPFNPVTKIKYSVKRETSNVKLIVFDMQGKQITELVNRKQSAGIYEVDFSGDSFSSGIYFYSLIMEGRVVDTRKMALVK